MSSLRFGARYRYDTYSQGSRQFRNLNAEGIRASIIGDRLHEESGKPTVVITDEGLPHRSVYMAQFAPATPSDYFDQPLPPALEKTRDLFRQGSDEEVDAFVREQRAQIV